MGCTEHTGLLSTIGIEDINDFIYCEFAGEGRATTYDGTIKPDTHYLYSYDERLLHPKKGGINADAVVEVSTPNGLVVWHIYLYEVLK
jgi:hypothetical protein